jgi:hypothetical protein
MVPGREATPLEAVPGKCQDEKCWDGIGHHRPGAVPFGTRSLSFPPGTTVPALPRRRFAAGSTSKVREGPKGRPLAMGSFIQCDDTCLIELTLRREHLGEMSDAQQLRHAACHVREFKRALPLLDGGRLEANQRSKACAIHMFHFSKIDSDGAAQRNKGTYQFSDLTRGAADQLAVTLDRGHWIAVLVLRTLKFTAERTISRHSVVSLSERACSAPSQAAILYDGG